MRALIEKWRAEADRLAEFRPGNATSAAWVWIQVAILRDCADELERSLSVLN